MPGTLVLRLRLARKCSISNRLMPESHVEVRSKTLNRNIVFISMTPCLKWLVSGLELSVLKITLTSVVSTIGLRSVWLTF